MTAPEVVNLADKLGGFSDHWNPRIVGRYNGNEVRVSKLKGEFVWHSHAETDELFLVLKGHLTIEFRDGVRALGLHDGGVVVRWTCSGRTALDAELTTLMNLHRGRVVAGMVLVGRAQGIPSVEAPPL